MSPASLRTDFAFTVDESWEALPTGFNHKDVAAVAVDSSDRVYLFTRHDSRVMVYDRDGSFITSWGEGVFTNPHGLTVAPDGSIYCVDNGDHTVKHFTSDGELLNTIGQPGRPSDTGRRYGTSFVVQRVETVERAAGPFNGCTNLAVAPNGDLYVADGYGNCRIHRFSADGELLESWGEIGVGPGEFHLPHGIAIGPDSRVYVCDRENDRLQIFGLHGEYCCEWTNVQRPDNIVFDGSGYAYVAELWRPKGMGSFVNGIMREDHPGRVSIFDTLGNVVARWGASTVSRDSPGHFVAPHDIAVDSHGDVYVAEVPFSFLVGEMDLGGDEFSSPQIQKFRRTR
jgi:DNA-binding beta-propeller fold protein YncE